MNKNQFWLVASAFVALAIIPDVVGNLIGQTTPGTDQAQICSVSEPSNNQVCVSIKFPWTENPVFFCTDHGNINYMPKCTDPNQSHHCYDDGRVDTMKIATPWDCCPIISTPNRCANVDCPPGPFNRTCKVVKILGDCCPTYFCDAGEADNCKSSRLKSACIQPPKGKVNCTVFRDPYGCCNKFQCLGDEKPGTCPVKRRNARQEDTSSSSTFGKVVDDIVSGAKETVHKVAVGVKSTLEKHGGEMGKAISKSIPVPFGPKFIPVPELYRCTGDYTCPGRMKCCRPAPLGYAVTHRLVHRQKVNAKGIRKSTVKVYRAEYYRVKTPNQPIDGICFDPEETDSTSSTTYDRNSFHSTESIVREERRTTQTSSAFYSSENSQITSSSTTSATIDFNSSYQQTTPDASVLESTQAVTTEKQMSPSPITTSATEELSPSVSPAHNKPREGKDYKETVVEE